MNTTFALCMADTHDDEIVGKNGTIYSPKTILNFLQNHTVMGCPVLSSDRETARQFPTRATAEKYKRSIGRPYYRVIRIAVESLRED
jgi:hypothetical protein